MIYGKNLFNLMLLPMSIALIGISIWGARVHAKARRGEVSTTRPALLISTVVLLFLYLVVICIA